MPLRCYADVQNESNWLVKPEAAVAPNDPLLKAQPRFTGYSTTWRLSLCLLKYEAQRKAMLLIRLFSF